MNQTNKYFLEKFSNTCEFCEEKIKIINGTKFIYKINSFLSDDDQAFTKHTKCKRPFYGTCLYKK